MHPFGPCPINVPCNSSRHRIASKDWNFHLNVSRYYRDFRIGVNHTAPQPGDTALAYPNNLSGRNRGHHHVTASTDRSCCKTSSHPCAVGAEGLCQQGGFLMVGVLALEFVRWRAVAQSVEAVRYKPEGRGFDS